MQTLNSIVNFVVFIWNEVVSWVKGAYLQVKVFILQTVPNAFQMSIQDLGGHRKRIDYLVLVAVFYFIRSGNLIVAIIAFGGFVLYMGFRLYNYDIQPSLSQLAPPTNVQVVKADPVPTDTPKKTA